MNINDRCDDCGYKESTCKCDDDGGPCDYNETFDSPDPYEYGSQEEYLEAQRQAEEIERITCASCQEICLPEDCVNTTHTVCGGEIK